MNENLEKLKKAKTMSECANIIYGISYTNGRVKKQIIEYCFKNYSINIIDILEQNNKVYCLNCGKEIEKGRKFCCQSCAASYNNKNKKHSSETKNKISNSLKDFHLNHPELRRKIYDYTCAYCGKEFKSIKKDAKFCSHECAWASEDVKDRIRDKVKERIDNGTFQGWKVRNVSSYSERFFENVLSDYNIEYQREDFSTKIYFLDFLITKGNTKIDLEIDGKQHTYADRQEHDKIRDEYLKKLGYVVYRIQWNEINSETGKETMKTKIKDFISFYNNIVGE